MFGGKEKAPTRVGAREKIRKAKALHGGGQQASIDSQREGGKGKTSPAVIFVMYYVMACVLAFLLAQGPLKDGLHGASIGIDGLDKILFGGGPQNFFGDPIIDTVITCMIRGVPIVLLAGVLPFFTLLWIRVRDNPAMSPLQTVWGVSIGLGIVILGCVQYIFPFLADAFKQITS